MLKKQRGYTLIELMIAMALGLVVMAGALTVFMATSNSNRDTLNAIKLHQELREGMSLVARDLRRAGSWNYTAAYALDNTISMSDNPFIQAASTSIGTDIDGNICDPSTTNCIYTCIEYSYDYPESSGDPDGVRNANSSLVQDSDNSERFGIGFKNNTLVMKTANNTCADGMVNWQSITDDSVVRITNFQIVDWYPAYYAGTQIRLLEIRLSGELVNDSNVSRDLVEYVRIRNDLLLP